MCAQNWLWSEINGQQLSNFLFIKLKLCFYICQLYFNEIYSIVVVGSSTISGDSTFQSILDDGEPNEDDESCATIDGSCITIDED